MRLAMTAEEKAQRNKLMASFQRHQIRQAKYHLAGARRQRRPMNKLRWLLQAMEALECLEEPRA